MFWGAVYAADKAPDIQSTGCETNTSKPEIKPFVFFSSNFDNFKIIVLLSLALIYAKL